MSDFERIINDSMIDEDGREWIVTYGDDVTNEEDYIPGYDDGEWIDTDDEWLDDFQGEEDWA